LISFTRAGKKMKAQKRQREMKGNRRANVCVARKCAENYLKKALERKRYIRGKRDA